MNAATDLAACSAVELLSLFRARSASPVEALQSVLARVDARNPSVNAFCLIDRELGGSLARASEARWLKGEPCGPLDGIPVPIKDSALTSGWPTLFGSRTSPREPGSTDAPYVANLRRAGAVLFGKTTTPEFAWKGVTDSPLTGITRNPSDLSKTSGGSSGGAAVAVACGMAPVATGGDAGGSIRIPGSFCGVYGIKPTTGRIPKLPGSALRTLAVAGPLSRTVEDSALLLNAMIGDGTAAQLELPPGGADFGAEARKGIAGLRIGFSANLGYVSVEQEIASAVLRAVALFEESGAHVEAADPGFDDPYWAFDTLWRVSQAHLIRRLTSEQWPMLDPALLDTGRSGLDIPSVRYAEALVECDRLAHKMADYHRRFDLLVTPTVPIAAFGAGLLTPDPVRYPTWYSWSPFTWPFNMTRQPASTSPCGVTSNGLPIGLQIVGPWYREDLVLRASAALEAAQARAVRHSGTVGATNKRRASSI